MEMVHTDGCACADGAFMYLHKFESKYLFYITFYLCMLCLSIMYIVYIYCLTVGHRITKKMKGRQQKNQLIVGTTKNVSAIFNKI